MIPRTRVPAPLQELFTAQAGAVSRDQVLGFGLSDRVIHRFLQEGTWRGVSAGVYSDRPESWLQLAWTGLLIGGPSAVKEPARGALPA